MNQCESYVRRSWNISLTLPSPVINTHRYVEKNHKTINYIELIVTNLLTLSCSKNIILQHHLQHHVFYFNCKLQIHVHPMFHSHKIFSITNCISTFSWPLHCLTTATQLKRQLQTVLLHITKTLVALQLTCVLKSNYFYMATHSLFCKKFKKLRSASHFPFLQSWNEIQESASGFETTIIFLSIKQLHVVQILLSQF